MIFEPQFDAEPNTNVAGLLLRAESEEDRSKLSGLLALFQTHGANFFITQIPNDVVA
jgi:hypothetical protein